MDEVQFARLSHPISAAIDLSRPVVTCEPEDTLESVLRRLDGHYHAYMVDGTGRPQSVVSLREVIAQFVCEPEQSQLSDYFTE